MKIKLYSIKINYYNDFTEKDEEEQCYIFADDIQDLGIKLKTLFEDYGSINNIFIKIINETCMSNTIIVPNNPDIIQAIDKLNDY